MTTLPITIEFECRDLPQVYAEQQPGLRLGIQKGKEVVDDVPVRAGEARFRFVLQARRDEETRRPVFTGPYAQGTPADRFVYLCWGERDGEQWQPSMRVKVPLGHLTWDQVQAAADRGEAINAILRLTDAKGRPVAATIKGQNVEWERA